MRPKARIGKISESAAPSPGARRPAWPDSLRAKALLALLAVALLAALNVLTVQYLLQRSDNIAAALNVAGKMRMLAQRAGLQALAAPATGQRAPFTRDQADFDAAWSALRAGGSAFGLHVQALSADLQAPLRSLEASWQHYQTLLARLPASERASEAQAAQVLDASAAMLTQSETLIDGMVARASRLQRNTALGSTLLFVLDVLLMAFAYLLFTRHVLRPIQALTRQSRSMAQGRYVTRVSVPAGEEFSELAQTLNASSERIAQLLLDIQTERQALARVQAMFDGLAQNDVAGIYMLDAQLRFVYVNEQLARMLGYPRSALQDGFEARRLFTDDTWPQVQRGIDERLQGRSRSARYECEALRSDGTPLLVEIFSSTMQLGEQPGIIGMFLDIGQRKHAEASLRQGSIVYRHTRDAIVITDKGGVVQDVNPAFTAITGYAPAEIIGRRMNLMSSGQHDRSFYQAMWMSLQQTGTWSGDIHNRRKNGEQFTEHLTISTAYNDDGSVNCRIGLFADVTEERMRSAALWRQAHYDHLTGLPNRQMFEQHLHASMEHARASGLPMALIFLDLDLFKQVNDTFGHDEGDALLQEAARRLLSLVRSSDLVARLGGDEFTIVLQDIRSSRDVEVVCEKVLHAIVQPYALQRNTVHISVSAGVAFYPRDAADSATLLKNADLAMYASKARGRNRYSEFSGALLEREQQRLQLLHELEKGLQREEFVLHYQPIVDMRTLRTVKAEALVRWQQPVHGLVSPAEFIPDAEESGLIVPLGDWVLRQATRQLQDWRAHIAPDFSLSVNVSPRQLHADEQKVQDWLDWLAQLGLPPHSLTVEITEGVLLEGDRATSDKMLALQRAGIAISLDDFGTGYSSLSYLKRFTIDYLKIDRSFVDKLPQSAEDGVLCNAIVAMAHQLGISVIAEGVETREQHDFLRAAGCDFGQGYWYGKPMAASAFAQRLQAEHTAPATF